MLSIKPLLKFSSIKFKNEQIMHNADANRYSNYR